MMRPEIRASRACVLVLAALAGSAATAGCGGATEPAPSPLRPEAEPRPEVVTEPEDCEPERAGAEPLARDDRSIEESGNLADSGFDWMDQARDRAEPLEAREAALAAAIDHFTKALAADPYNVRATYELAAAYAQIGRRGCALYLLARLQPLGELRSAQDEVEEVVARLLGRGDHEGRMDPAFFDLRDDPQFRRLVADF